MGGWEALWERKLMEFGNYILFQWKKHYHKCGRMSQSTLLRDTHRPPTVRRLSPCQISPLCLICGVPKRTPWRKSTLSWSQTIHPPSAKSPQLSLSPPRISMEWSMPSSRTSWITPPSTSTFYLPSNKSKLSSKTPQRSQSAYYPLVVPSDHFEPHSTSSSSIPRRIRRQARGCTSMMKSRKASPLSSSKMTPVVKICHLIKKTSAWQSSSPSVIR